MRSHTGTLRLAILLAVLWLAPQICTAHDNVLQLRARTSAELVNAILAANAHSGTAVIKVAPGHFVLTERFDSAFGPSRLPPVKSTIFLIGDNAATTILETDGFFQAGRLLTVLPHGRITIRRMTLSGGSAADLGESSATGGGAIGNFGGFLRVDDCVLSQNDAANESGTGAGGAILSIDGRLHVEGSRLENNIGVNRGGAIVMLRGSGLIRRSIISGNQAGGQPGGLAGGILVIEGTLGIYGSTIARNVVDSGDLDNEVDGGGIVNLRGRIWLINSAVVENVAQPIGFGGGIWNTGTLYILNTTIGGNSTASSGGGIYNLEKGTIRLHNATIVANDAGGLTDPNDHIPTGCTTETLEGCVAGGGGIWNLASARIVMAATVIAGNQARLSADCNGRFVSDGHNAVGDKDHCKLVPFVPGQVANDLVGVDPRVGELEDDGEPGRAHVPLHANSPLIDAGGRVNHDCTPLDQLGQPRVDGNNNGKTFCDIGAIEFQPKRRN